MKKICIAVALVVFTLAGMGQQLTPAAGKADHDAGAPQPSGRDRQAEPHRGEKTGPKLPLEFEANRGQAAAEYNYVAHGPTYALGIAPTEIALSLRAPGAAAKANLVSAALDRTARGHGGREGEAQLHLRLAGANRQATVAGLDPKPGLSNYFIGNDPTKWQTRVPHFGKVSMAGVYPGIDLVFYGNPEQLEYDFRVRPGADPAAIRLSAGDAKLAALDDNGDAVLSTAGGEVRLKHPVAYQEIGNERRRVESTFQIADGRTLQFKVGWYDHSKTLIIDPVLLYSVAISTSGGNQGFGMDVDSAGNSYVTGNACSADFPTTAGNYQNFQNDVAGFACQNAFVFKLDATGSTLIYSDFVGGSGASTGTHVAVDSSGDAYVTGATTSTDFPLIANIGPSTTQACPLFTSYSTNCPDGFIFKLSPDGSSMAFSSLLGGSQTDLGFQVKLNPVTGDVVVLGDTDSSDFLPKLTTLQTSYEGGTCANDTPCLNAFLIGLNPDTGALRYGSYLGGAGDSFAGGLAFDTSGNAYVAGSATLPLSSSLGAATHTYTPSGASAGGMDIFVTQLKLKESALSVGYLTLIEGESDDVPAGIAVDASGNAYVTGTTASKHLPVTSGVYQSTNPSTGAAGCILGFSFPPVSCGTAFVGKLGSTGALSFLTYLGGNGTDWGEAVGVDGSGNIWLAGATSSTDFPFSADSYAPDTNYDMTPYLAEMPNTGAALTYASPLAGVFGGASDLKIDSNNNVYVTGDGLNPPSTPGTYGSTTLANLSAVPLFVEKWNAGAAPAIQLSTTSITFPATAVGALSAPQTITVTNSGSGALQLGARIITSLYGDLSDAAPPDFLEYDNCGGSLAGGGSCTITLQFEPQGSPAPCTTANGCYPQTLTGELIVLNNAPAGTQKVLLSGTLGQGPIFAAAPASVLFTPQTAGTTSQQVQVNADNLGDLPLQISNVSISGSDASEFQVTQASGYGCVGAGVSPVGSGGTCVVYVTFSPAAAATGTQTATLTFADNAPGSPHSVPLSGAVATAAPGLVISPTSATLGAAAIGATTNPDDCSACAFFTISNSSSNSLQLTALTLSGANAADFTLRANPALPVTIQAGNQISIEVYFSPASGSPGVRTATITPATNPSATGLPTIQLTGEAVNNSDPSLFTFSNPSPLDLGTALVGQTSAVNSNFINIGNRVPYPCAGGATSCGGPLVISSIAAGNSDFTLFQPTESSNPSYCSTSAMTIPAGGVCQFVVLFAPTQAGNRNTSLVFKSNDLLSPLSLPLLGTGVTSALGNLSATSINFGYNAVEAVSPQQTVTVTNVGSANLSIASVTASTNFPVASNTCTAAVAPGKTCTIGVTFKPPSAGGYSGTLTITDNDGLSATQVVALNGIGATGTLLALTPETVNFGNQVVGDASAAHTISIINTGDAAVTISANAFRISKDFLLQGTTCGTSLAVGASCTASVQFKPSIAYTESGSLTLNDNARGNPQTVFMTGSGVQAGSNATTTALSVTPNPAQAGQAVTMTATVAGSGSSSEPTGNVAFSVDGGVAATVALNGSAGAAYSTSGLAAGQHSVQASYSGDSNFAASVSTSVTETIQQATQTITFTPPPSPVYYPDSPITLVATGGGSGNPVTFSIVSGPGSLSGTNDSTLTITGTGTIVIAANQAGNASYSAAPKVTQSVTVLSPTLAALSTPQPGTALAGADVTFTWSTGTGVSEYYFQLGSEGAGSYNLFNPGATTAHSASATGLPTNGETIYARLGSKVNGTWEHADTTYIAAATPAALTSPSPGSTLTGSSVKFSWSAGAGVSEYYFQLGSNGAGSYNLFNTGATTELSASAIGLPTNSETIYARLGSKINGTWHETDYTYKAGSAASALYAPTPGSVLGGANVTFSWTAGEGATEYFLSLGSAGAGSDNLYNPGATTALSANVTGLPVNDETIYARLGSKVNGVWQSTDYTYKAAATPAALTTPAPGSTLAGASVTFDWTAGSGPTEYFLSLGSKGVGSDDLYNPGATTARTANVTGLPTNGETIYARLGSKINGAWVAVDYTYTAK